MNSRQIRQSLILLLTAVIWGVAFVAQSVGMDYVGPFTFICARSLIGGLVLLPCITLLKWTAEKKHRQEKAAPGGHLLRPCPLYRKLLSAVRHSVYKRGKGRIPYGLLYHHCPHFRALFR